MTPARWRQLRRQIEDIVTAEIGVSFEELAERTAVSFPEVRAAVWKLYGARRVDVCLGYVCLPSSPAAERRSA